MLFWESVKGQRPTRRSIQSAIWSAIPNSTFEACWRAVGSGGWMQRVRRSTESSSPAPGPPRSAFSAGVEESTQVEAEREFWVLVKETEVPSDLEAYLEQYPDGVYAPVVRACGWHSYGASARRSKRARVPLTQPRRKVHPLRSASSPSATAPAAAPAVPSLEEVESSLGLGRGARRMVQAGLSSLGYEPGPADGVFGARTRDAIRRYQGEKWFEATGYLRAEESQALVALGEEAALAQAKAERREVQAEATRQEAETRERERREQAPGRRFRDCAECPELVVVPAGSFMMGSPSSDSKGYSAERPVHRVTIGEPIAVGVYEVTFGEWDACRRGGGCSHNPGDSGWGRGTRPVIEMSWEDAQEYVRWLSRETGKRYRLMSESEWEYVARAGTETRYHWGDAAGRNRANCKGCGSRWDNRQTSPVGSFSANAFGLHDVHGNVWEWVEDCWHGDYAGAPPDGSARTSGGDCSRRVLRGGSWMFNPGDVRSAYRFGLAAGGRSFFLGFRVARTLN